MIKWFWFQQRRCNTERFSVFRTVIIQRDRHMNSSGAIRMRIDLRLDASEAGEFEMLAEDMARTCAQYLSTSMGEDTLEHWAKV